MERKYIPVISGTASIAFLEFLIFDNSLNIDKYQTAILAVCVIFIVSAILFYLLSKLEKEKDVVVLEKIQKIVESVFEKYGTAVANNSHSIPQTDDMNKIMQTIVNLAKELHVISEKEYKK